MYTLGRLYTHTQTRVHTHTDGHMHTHTHTHKAVPRAILSERAKNTKGKGSVMLMLMMIAHLTYRAEIG